MITCDLIVIGLGGVGSSAAMHAARHGRSVVGIEQFPLVHARGSSHGQTRAIRQAYFEHPDYVPLIKRAYELWDELADVSGRELLHRCGVVQAGPPDGEIITGVLQSAAKHSLQVEQLDSAQAKQEFPGFHFAESMQVLFEQNAGYLHVERCVETHLDQAMQLGADCRGNETVIKWNSDGQSVLVETDRQKYSAAKLIISAGAWTTGLLQAWDIELRVLRKHSYWYQTDSKIYGAGQGSPVFLYDTPAGLIYGFPVIDDRGLKIANHSGGEVITDPTNLDRNDNQLECTKIEAFLSSHLPELRGRLNDHSVCMYTVSRDGHFVVDLHPEHSNVVIAAGLSGHGFKFVSALGEALIALLDDRPPHATEFLRTHRFH